MAPKILYPSPKNLQKRGLPKNWTSQGPVVQECSQDQNVLSASLHSVKQVKVEHYGHRLSTKQQTQLSKSRTFIYCFESVSTDSGGRTLSHGSVKAQSYLSRPQNKVESRKIWKYLKFKKIDYKYTYTLSGSRWIWRGEIGKNSEFNKIQKNRDKLQVKEDKMLEFKELR